MKRSFLAAGIGLCIFAVTMVVSNHPVQAQVYNGNIIEQDTTPKKKRYNQKETRYNASESVFTYNITKVK